MPERRVSLLVTAGDGPAECNQAVGHILDRMGEEAERNALDLSVHRSEGQHGPRSAVVLVDGADADDFAGRWLGTIQWRMQSSIRPNHKRANWFVGVFRLDQRTETDIAIRDSDVTFSALRAGGPGGQHQNTTDSAVRAVHRATGLVVVVRDGRSQHRNKALALKRLANLIQARALADRELMKSSHNRLHRELDRGNPVRRFKGERFVEVD